AVLTPPGQHDPERAEQHEGPADDGLHDPQLVGRYRIEVPGPYAGPQAEKGADGGGDEDQADGAHGRLVVHDRSSWSTHRAARRWRPRGALRDAGAPGAAMHEHPCPPVTARGSGCPPGRGQGVQVVGARAKRVLEKTRPLQIEVRVALPGVAHATMV